MVTPAPPDADPPQGELRGDGLPSLPTGEPVLARWFAVAMLLLVPAGIGIVVWAFLSIGDSGIPVAARRPPGTATVTHATGELVEPTTADAEAGPGCASGVRLTGDAGARSTGRRALAALCQLLDSGSFPDAEAGLARWDDAGGRLAVAVFEQTGVDATARSDDRGITILLNAKFQFGDAALAAPFVLHELVHVGSDTWPGAPVAASAELAAMQAQWLACDRLAARDGLPRGCSDAAELAESPDPLGELRDAGYRSG